MDFSLSFTVHPGCVEPSDSFSVVGINQGEPPYKLSAWIVGRLLLSDAALHLVVQTHCLLRRRSRPHRRDAAVKTLRFCSHGELDARALATVDGRVRYIHVHCWPLARRSNC